MSDLSIDKVILEALDEAVPMLAHIVKVHSESRGVGSLYEDWKHLERACTTLSTVSDTRIRLREYMAKQKTAKPAAKPK